ncbi:MAG: histidine ammonia-lyase [Legionellales bacterium]|nr:histidine ammonia-lyase [Legionellales bacterium]
MATSLAVGNLDLAFFQQAMKNPQIITLDQNTLQQIKRNQHIVLNILNDNQTVYGINTGFGALANKSILPAEIVELQKRILLSHAAGVGNFLQDEIVSAILLMKINALAQGFSGVSVELVQALIKLYNAKVYPRIPSQGSLGASGDLAPLAHLGCVLLGVGEVSYSGKILSAQEGLTIAGIHQPYQFKAKEGLALINGTQVSTAIVLFAYYQAIHLLELAILTGSLSLDAARGSLKPFDERIAQLRRQPGQIKVAKLYRDYLNGSEILQSHQNCQHVQDPYSLRCQSQVMGAVCDQLTFIATILENEINAVTDNPLVFSEDNTIISGGNFHAEPIAFAADNLALAIAEIGSLSERRIALLMDDRFSQLPAFLVKESGLNSGLMIAHYTATALASENKALAHPRSVDSLPTSANQEDHVSMATNAGLRLLTMIEHCETILAIEFLAAAQGIDFHQPLKTSKLLQTAHQALRQVVPFYDQDRYVAADIATAKIILNQLAVQKLY